MKLDIITVSIAVVLMTFIPIFLLIFFGNEKSREVLNIFEAEKKRLGLNFNFQDRWNLNMIGIDVNKKIMLLVQNIEDSIFIEAINLEGLENVEVIPSYKTIAGNNLLEEVIIFLSFRNRGDKTLRLFHCDWGMLENYEINRAKKFSTWIKNTWVPGYKKVA